MLGMGLPTVAAYVIGAILFVPALQRLGVDQLASHFYVLFFAVLSMMTPPVALASYTAAGIAGANPNRPDCTRLRWPAVVSHSDRIRARSRNPVRR